MFSSYFVLSIISPYNLSDARQQGSNWSEETDRKGCAVFGKGA